MDTGPDNLFVVYVRADRSQDRPPESVEQPIMTCHSYAEARQVARNALGEHQECVIRFLGPTGGGD